MTRKNTIKIDSYSDVRDYPQLQNKVFEDDFLLADYLTSKLYNDNDDGYFVYETLISTFGLIISNFYFYSKKKDNKRFLFSKKTFRQLNDGLFELTILYFDKEYVLSKN